MAALCYVANMVKASQTLRARISTSLTEKQEKQVIDRATAHGVKPSIYLRELIADALEFELVAADLVREVGERSLLADSARDRLLVAVLLQEARLRATTLRDRLRAARQDEAEKKT